VGAKYGAVWENWTTVLAEGPMGVAYGRGLEHVGIIFLF
jgi:hypothetical protein